MATKKSNLKILFIVLAVAVVGFVAFKFFGKSKGETAGDSDDAETGVNTSNKSTAKKSTKKSVTVEADESELDELCEKFIKTCNDYGNSATAASHPWDTKTLKEIMALPTNDLVRLNSMFKAAAACTYSDNYGAVKSKYYTRTSLSDAIPAGTRCKYRTGASTAFAFKEKMESLGL